MCVNICVCILCVHLVHVVCVHFVCVRACVHACVNACVNVFFPEAKALVVTFPLNNYERQKSEVHTHTRVYTHIYARIYTRFLHTHLHTRLHTGRSMGESVSGLRVEKTTWNAHRVFCRGVIHFVCVCTFCMCVYICAGLSCCACLILSLSLVCNFVCVQRSISDELDRSSSTDINTVFISYLVMFVYISLALGMLVCLCLCFTHAIRHTFTHIKHRKIPL